MVYSYIGIIFATILTLIGWAIYLEDGGSPFFRQQRVGKDGQLFELLKFRSMAVNTANVPSAQASSSSITQVDALPP